MNKTILVATDNNDLLRTIAANRNLIDYVIRGTKSTGEELISYIKDITPDLLVLDTSITSLDGLRQLISIRSNCDISTLVLSSKNCTANNVFILDQDNPDSFFIKLVPLEQIILQIKETLNYSISQNQELRNSKKAKLSLIRPIPS